MRTLLLLLYLGILAGCSSGYVNPGSISGAVPPLGQQPTEEGEMDTPTAMPKQDTPGETPTPFRADLEDYGPAPELINEVWLNTDQPLRLAELRGRVVLLEMWTFG